MSISPNGQQFVGPADGARPMSAEHKRVGPRTRSPRVMVFVGPHRYAGAELIAGASLSQQLGAPCFVVFVRPGEVWLYSDLGTDEGTAWRQPAFDDVSAVHRADNKLMVKWVKNAIAKTGVRKICCAGGAFLNVKANKLIRELPEVEAFYAYPASDDGGTPVGGAILGYLQLCKEKGITPTLQPRKDMYLGLSFSDEECEAAAKQSGLPYHKMSNPAQELAQMIANGQIIARFAGGEEVGPRALGNRSIVADPRSTNVIRKLNFAIKQRDFWMPFAASILEEDAARYIRDLKGWPFYMIEAFDTTKEAGEQLIAGMHPFDMTIRPQLVNEINPKYRELIRAFKALTGVGGVLNTSFNLHGYPIVGSPKVALDTLLASDLDALQLNDFLVSKKS